MPSYSWDWSYDFGGSGRSGGGFLNAILWEDGTIILWEDGNYIQWES